MIPKLIKVLFSLDVSTVAVVKVVEARGTDLPLVVCGNKTDCDERQVDRVETEALVQLDWEVGIIL